MYGIVDLYGACAGISIFNRNAQNEASNPMRNRPTQPESEDSPQETQSTKRKYSIAAIYCTRTVNVTVSLQTLYKGYVCSNYF